MKAINNIQIKLEKVLIEIENSFNKAASLIKAQDYEEVSKIKEQQLLYYQNLRLLQLELFELKGSNKVKSSTDLDKIDLLLNKIHLVNY